MVFKQVEKNMDTWRYRVFLKIIELYTLNIVTRNETVDLLEEVGIDKVNFDNIKEILESREHDRRKKSAFKPLGDLNFSNAERPSPSYVNVPPVYPIYCSSKTQAIKALTNDKWVSVPYGSE